MTSVSAEARPTGIIEVNRTGTITRANSGAIALFGYDSDEELVGQPLAVLIPPRFRERHAMHFKKYFERLPGDLGYRQFGASRALTGLSKSSSEFPIEIALMPVQSSDGETHVVGFTTNTSNQGPLTDVPVQCGV